MRSQTRTRTHVATPAYFAPTQSHATDHSSHTDVHLRGHTHRRRTFDTQDRSLKSKVDAAKAAITKNRTSQADAEERRAAGRTELPPPICTFLPLLHCVALLPVRACCRSVFHCAVRASLSRQPWHARRFHFRCSVCIAQVRYTCCGVCIDFSVTAIPE